MKHIHRTFGNPMFLTIVTYLFINAILYVNILSFKSSIIGFIASVAYIYLSSTLCGKILFEDEGPLNKTVFGFLVFITSLSLGGALALGFYQLAVHETILLLFSIAFTLIVLNLKRYGFRRLFGNSQALRDVGHSDMKKQEGITLLSLERVLLLLYIVLVSVCFVFLFLSRSGEVSFVPDAIHPAFFLSYFSATFFLLLVLLSKTSKRVKLFLVMIHSFTIHVLLVIVLNPGFHGDQWSELGFARDVYNFGKNLPNLFDFLLGGVSGSPYFVVYFSFRKRVHQALVTIFAHMFNVDAYWSHMFLAPVLWTTFIPFLLYKNLRILGGKKNCSILAAFLSLSVPMLIWYSAITVPQSLSFLFFFLTVHFTLRYLSCSQMKTSTLLLMFTVSLTAFLTHFNSGILCFAIFLLAYAFKQYDVAKEKSVRVKIELALSIFLCCAILPLALFGLYEVYPLAGYMHVRFSVEKLLTTNIWALILGDYVNFSLTKLLLAGTVPFLGIVGLMYITYKRRYNRSLSVFMLLAVMIFLVDYRVLKYAMVNVPFNPERLWIFRDLLVIPYAAVMIKEIYQRLPVVHLQILGRRTFRFSATAFTCCLMLSGLFMAVAENGFAYKPSPLNPTPYEVAAIQYIHKNTIGKYAVIGDGTFVGLARGILGSRLSRGTYLTYEPFNKMVNQPSADILVEQMAYTDSSTGFFVISTRLASFRRVVESAQAIFDTYLILSNSIMQLYVFSYPLIERSFAIPIKIDSGNLSRANYPIEYQVNWTQVLYTLSGLHLDPNSVRVIAPEGEVPSQLDYFQAWDENCSSSDKWSVERLNPPTSDGDVLTLTAYLTSDIQGNLGKLTYTEFERDGGDLKVDSQKYNHIEIKWKTNYDNVVNLRISLFYKVGGKVEVKTRWAYPSTEWSVWRYDYSLPNGTLYGLSIEFFDASPGTWVGDYELYIDWLRFVSDIGTVRFFHNGMANSEKLYTIEYDFLERTEISKKDGLSPKLYPNSITLVKGANTFNISWTWDDRIVNFVIEKDAREWIGTSGRSFSYVLIVDGINILTYDPSNRGGLGVMQAFNSMYDMGVNFSRACLTSDGPVMKEICFEMNEYGNLYVRFYQGSHLRIALHTESENRGVGPSNDHFFWLISTNCLDDKVYYVNENSEVEAEDLFEQGTWRAQGIAQYESHGYLIALSDSTATVGNYSASYNNFGMDDLDFISYLDESLYEVDFMFTISKNQSLQEMKNIVLETKNPPSLLPWAAIPLSVKIVDLLDQPLDDVSVEIRELGMKTSTDVDGWAQLFVPQGKWTLVASKNGYMNEGMIETLASTLTMQRFALIKIEGLTMNMWVFVASASLLVLSCVFLLLLFYKKIVSGIIYRDKRI